MTELKEVSYTGIILNHLNQFDQKYQRGEAEFQIVFDENIRKTNGWLKNWTIMDAVILEIGTVYRFNTITDRLFTVQI
jgi:hypothetical protein